MLFLDPLTFPFFFVCFFHVVRSQIIVFPTFFFSLVKCFLLDASARDSLEPFLEFFACTPSHHKPTLTFSQTAHYFFPSTFGVSHFFFIFWIFLFWNWVSPSHIFFCYFGYFFGRFKKKVKGERKRKKKTPGWELNARTTNGGRKTTHFCAQTRTRENRTKQ